MLHCGAEGRQGSGAEVDAYGNHHLACPGVVSSLKVRGFRSLTRRSVRKVGSCRNSGCRAQQHRRFTPTTVASTSLPREQRATTKHCAATQPSSPPYALAAPVAGADAWMGYDGMTTCPSGPTASRATRTRRSSRGGPAFARGPRKRPPFGPSPVRDHRGWGTEAVAGAVELHGLGNLKAGSLGTASSQAPPYPACERKSAGCRAGNNTRLR